ncbi:hypothetical protein M406DRAFT_73815 [Cryphonectria parasitica EP155]|uniref:Uncharacterized protein n=1 Tax=Cryphonectria parasitica (strain ATCC 38755 / EP155) TaxID=660469 RepID=A0A9P5CLL2_CRYP1|nr:uncharacterized protein M406DRAFT_73815 [Cryphonectria parasitica EP155]KAF3763188.1 hypothetical protein M406DRAFT_73815 [Cryphonectria parasitica EP155]
MRLYLLLTYLSMVWALPGTLANPTHTVGLEPRTGPTTSCGIWVTGSRSSAQNLQSQLAECSSNLWGTSFTVPGKRVDASSSPCIGLACDPKTQTQFMNALIKQNVFDVNTVQDNIGQLVTKNCTDIAHSAQQLLDDCCTDHSSDGISGQYAFGDGTNINVVYSWSCHTDETPSDPCPTAGTHCPTNLPQCKD